MKLNPAFPGLSFQNSTGTVEIVLQVANFTHRKGGLWTEIIMGTPGQLHTLREKQAFSTLFLCGGLLIMAVYHLGLYLLRRNDRAPLFCALLFFLIAARASVIGEIFLLSYFPGLSWYLCLYYTVFLDFPGVPLSSIHERLYPDEIPAKLAKATWVTARLKSYVLLIRQRSTPGSCRFMRYLLWLCTFCFGSRPDSRNCNKREARSFPPGTAALVMAVVMTPWFPMI